MAKDTTALQALIAPTVTALGYELVGCVYMPQGRHGLLRIYIDSENGIKLEDCEKVSRQISGVLDVEDPIAGTYNLEVSSPGLDRPLFTLQHYQRFIGKTANLKLHTPIEKRRHLKGKLQAVVADKIVIKVDEMEFTVPLANIAKANLLVDTSDKD